MRRVLFEPILFEHSHKEGLRGQLANGGPSLSAVSAMAFQVGPDGGWNNWQTQRSNEWVLSLAHLREHPKHGRDPCKKFDRSRHKIRFGSECRVGHINPGRKALTA